MTQAGIIAALLLLLVGGAQADDKPSSLREPYHLVRSLQALQDQIGRGNIEAHNAQPALLKRLGEEFQAADISVWKDPRNSRAVLTFLLSGGAPEVVVALRARKVLDIDDAILDGALAYVQGRPEEAKARLGTISARSFPPALGAEIAMVQSALLAQSDFKAAIERLDEVRLLMPGTLVEEAALRREIFLVGQVDDFDKFESLALQYFRRYRHSVYAGNFRQRFALAVARFSFVQQPDRFPRLVAIIDNLDQPSQRGLYLLVARTSLLRGKVEMTDLAARRIAALAEEGSDDRLRADLYRAAARVVTNANPEAIRDLQQIDVTKLAERDAELLAAALAMGRNVRKALPVVSARSEAPANEQTAVRPRIDFNPSLSIVDRAQKLLADSAERLKEQNK
jgi:chemotaxis protein MotC